MGPFPSPLNNKGLAFDWSDSLYGASDGDDSLFSIDLLTGASTIIGPFVQTCYTNILGLTFAPDDVDLSGLLAEPPP